MSVIMDFSFKNPMISDYFKGSDKYVPVPEMMYIHSHPLVMPNFIAEIEELINNTHGVLLSKNVKQGSSNRLVQLAQSLGKLLPILDDNNAAEALCVLREIYKLCLVITGK